jgi:hypothetical protein
MGTQTTGYAELSISNLPAWQPHGDALYYTSYCEDIPFILLLIFASYFVSLTLIAIILVDLVNSHLIRDLPDERQ